ncbi:SSI family serine proteinase inhibitor [Streptomyces sp. NPDC058475]|uniref:SSI family serine proteinase inhibitor n=1 Tax=unclassified Streptomyces TaxID=2593676 RepID=UPI003659BC1F
MLSRLVLTTAATATAALSTAVPAASAAPAAPVAPLSSLAMSSPSGPSGPSGATSAARPATTSYGEPVLQGLARTMPPPAGGEESGDRLTVTVHDAGGGADGTYELRCHPGGGTHPDVSGACDKLDRSTTWGKDIFAPVPPGAMCTMLYGGPATAHVTGTWAGRPVDARFDRTNGCEIGRWDALVPLLPDTRA